jgi:hypothetical protein
MTLAGEFLASPGWRQAAQRERGRRPPNSS